MSELPDGNEVEFDNDDQTPQEPSLRDELEAAYEELAPEDEVEAVPSERSRDDKGRFLTDSTSGEPEEPATDEQDMPTLAPPASWSHEDYELFYQLPRAAQEKVLARETDLRRYLTRESEKIATQARTYAELESTIAKHEEFLKTLQAPRGEVIDRLLQWQQYLDRDPVQGIKTLAQSFGLDLQQLAQNNYEAQTAQPVSPEVIALRQEIAQLRNAVVERQQPQAQPQQSNAEVVANILHATDESGQLLYPYANHVENEMITIAQGLIAQNPHMDVREWIDRSYNMALRASDKGQALLARATKAQEETARKEQERQQRQQRAKQLAKGSSSAASSASNGLDKASDLRGLLEAAWESQR